MSDRPLFLVGFMGSGKSTLARLLAVELGWDCADTDALVEKREGRTIATIFEESGEEYFRQAEWEILQTLLGRRRWVVATGGGLFRRCDARRRMSREGATVWLDVPLEECRARVQPATDRPLWEPGDPLALRALFERRRAVYALAAVRVPAVGEPPGATSWRVLERLRSNIP